MLLLSILSLIAIAYCVHVALRSWTIDRINRDATKRINGAKRLRFQSKFYQLNKGFKRS